MHKNILVIASLLITLGITAFTFLIKSDTKADSKRMTCSESIDHNKFFELTSTKQVNPDLLYKVQNRWNNNMIKEEIDQVTGIHNITGEDAGVKRRAYKNVRLSLLKNDRDAEFTEIGQSEQFTDGQLELLRSSTHSANLRLTALNQKFMPEIGKFRDDSLVFYLSIVPFKQAEFEGGFEALVEFLKTSSKEKVSIIDEKKLEPCKINFTVTKTGKVEHVHVAGTSGYKSVDEELLKLISNMPEKWKSATNADGQRVDQEFVFFFGIEGC